MARFQTKIKHARFEVIGYTPEQMVTVGTALRDSIEQRILRAEDVYDSAAPPLKIPISKPPSRRGSLQSYQRNYYPRQKERRGAQAIRDWKFSGILLRHMKVLTASANKAVIGFIDAVHPVSAYAARKKNPQSYMAKNPLTMDQIAAINNKRWRQFGVSPANRAVVVQALRSLGNFIRVRAA